MDYFTSDNHFYHANIIRLCNRPYKDVDEMNVQMIANWNKVVGPNDVVRHCGDFAFTLHQMEELLPALNGTIYLIPGNHDKWIYDKNISMFLEKFMHKLVIMPPQYAIEYKTNKTKNVMLVLNHYPMRSWEHSHHGSWHLYGHMHNTKNNSQYSYGLSFDIGVDAHNFAPVSLEEVIEEMNNVKTSNIPYPIYERRYGVSI